MRDRKPTRRCDYNYTRPGFYFITFNTRGRRRLLSNIEEGEVLLTPLGQECAGLVADLPERFAGVEVESSVIMPDHIHLLIAIAPSCDKGMSDVLRWFKSRSAKTFYARGGHGTLWQRGAWDVIVEDDEALDRIRHYIHMNPVRWEREHAQHDAVRLASSAP